MDGMSPNHARETRSKGWKSLRVLVIAVGVALSPLFFADMFANVRHLLLPGMGSRSWIVPAATEGSFLFLFLLDVLLLLARKPQAWLRWAPFLFAAMSLALNVWGGHGSVLLSIGYGAVTLAFFVPIVAGEQAIRSMSVTEQDVRSGQEMKAAMRHARDLVRAHAGWRRWRAPALLRIQIRHARPPASVAAAIRDGAAFGGAAKWEEPVEEWVVRSLTRNAAVAARMAAEKHAIEAAAGGTAQGSAEGSADGTRGGSGGSTPGRTRRGRPGGSDWPETKDVNAAVLMRRVKAAIERYERANDGKRLPAVQLSALLKVRMSRDTAGELLRQAYGDSGTQEAVR
jgi:hypothetical protein